jgi:hypothetical protein
LIARELWVEILQVNIALHYSQDSISRGGVFRNVHSEVRFMLEALERESLLKRLFTDPFHPRQRREVVRNTREEVVNVQLFGRDETPHSLLVVYVHRKD